MLAADASEDELAKEIDECDGYTSQFKTLKISHKYNKEAACESSSSNGNNNFTKVRKFKLPQIKFKSFSGDIKEWLPFWSQYKIIHEEAMIPAENKFQYLLFAITPGTGTKEFVTSYPPSTENYAKVIKSLKWRFGREDILVEVYIRELLKLLVNKVISNQNKDNITVLYDKIETRLRGPETLGIATDTCAAM